MEYPIGIEMSKDYLSYEVSKAAYKLVHDVMLVQPGENVVNYPEIPLRINVYWKLS